MKKIAYLVSCYPAISATFILREILSLRKKGLEIDVASINLPHPPKNGWPKLEKNELSKTFIVKKRKFFKAITDVAITLLTHPLSSVFTLFKCLWWSGAAPKQILKMGAYFIEACLVGRWMKRIKSTHLHVHFGNAGATVGLLAKNIFHFKYTLTLHGPDTFYNAEQFLIKEKVVSSDWIACISHYCKAQLLFLAGPEVKEKLHFLPLGVDTERDFPIKKETGSLHLLCIGRAVQAKGGYDLLVAFKELSKILSNIKLTYIGDGPELLKMKQLTKHLDLSDQIEFTGALGQPETQARLSEADIFVLPSYAEGLPVALMEAMALKIPCVSTYIAGIPELIEHNVNGLLIPAGHSKALVKALLKLGSDPLMRETLGKAARERVLKHYSLKKNTDTLYEQFTETK